MRKEEEKSNAEIERHRRKEQKDIGGDALCQLRKN
jgi:hypothetical protein